MMQSSSISPLGRSSGTAGMVHCETASSSSSTSCETLSLATKQKLYKNGSNQNVICFTVFVHQLDCSK
jgi:hypothetical protein